MAATWHETEVITNLYVGDLQDARRFDGAIINVLPDVPDGEPARAVHMPILADGIASMDQTAALIDELLSDGNRVLVHCEEGCERAPLVVAWYLKVRRAMTLDEAYALLKRRRPIVQDRRRWLGADS
ncbi:MAG TPA: dual specificity protein phosphatase [Candidatus Acidoferrales bacterium]|nr:dual specificity protein phosphatase [Candidatus Acidoferrales bacterium]